MRHLPPLSAIRAFEAAARHKNYTRAGEELGLTQAGVSYQIKSLEQHVGTVLFARRGRIMELTAAGEELAPQIAQAFLTMDNAFSSLGDSEDAVLAIACFQTFASTVLAPRLGSFQVAHPEIAVRLVVSDAYADLEAGECDLAIRLSRDVPASLRSHDLMSLGIAPFVSPATAKRWAGMDLDTLEFADGDRISPKNTFWHEWDAAHGVTEVGLTGSSRGTTQRSLEFDSQILDAAAASGGNGVALLAPALFHSDIAEGRLVRLGQRIVRPGQTFRLVYPEVRRHSAKVRAFRNWLTREFEPMIAADPGAAPDR